MLRLPVDCSNTLVELDTTFDEDCNLSDLDVAYDEEYDGLTNLSIADDNTCSKEVNVCDYRMDKCTVSREQNHFMPTGCCSQQCIASFSRIELENIHTIFKMKSQGEQQQFIMDQMSTSSVISFATTFGKVKYLNLNGKQVCKQAFTKLLGTLYARVKTIYCKMTSGIQRIHGNQHKPKPLSSKHTSMVAWLETYANKVGEKMPHLQQIHLPHFLTKKAVLISNNER